MSSQAIHVIANNVPGYGPIDGRYHSGFYGRSVSVSPSSFHKRFPLSSVCYASSSSHGRNSDFSRHQNNNNRHGFSRRRNNRQQNEDHQHRYGVENYEEPESLSSRSNNGPLMPATTTTSAKFHGPPTPGQREKEIVELFRKVQAQLRQRTKIKEEKRVDESHSENKESGTVDSLLQVLRKHTVQQGKKSRSIKDFSIDHHQPEKEKFENDGSFNTNNTAKYVRANEIEPGRRPVSNFRRRSPVPQIKFNEHEEQPLKFHGRVKEEMKPKIEIEVEPEPEPERELELVPESRVSFEDVFGEDTEDEKVDSEDEEEEEYGDEGDGDEEDDNGVVEDLSGMTVAELRGVAKSRGMKGYSKLKKQDLLEMLGKC